MLRNASDTINAFGEGFLPGQVKPENTELMVGAIESHWDDHARVPAPKPAKWPIEALSKLPEKLRLA